MKKLLISTVIAGAFIAAPTFYALNYLETKTTEQVRALPFVDSVESSDSKLNFDTGSIILTHKVRDTFGGEWALASVMEMDWKAKSIKSLSRATPANQATLQNNIQIIDPENNTLKAAAFGEYKLDSQHIEVEVEPFLVQDQGSSLLLPASLFIVDNDSNNRTATFAFVDPVQINHLGQITSMSNLRAQYINQADKNGHIIVKLDAVKVGDLPIVDDATITFDVLSNEKKEHAQLSVLVKNTPFFDDVDVNLSINNLVKGELVSLTKYAADYAIAKDPLIKSNAKLGLLKHAITFGKNQGQMKVEVNALTKKTQESIEVSSSVGYSEDSAALIDENNALSLMHYAKASLAFTAPTWQTEAMLPPEWMMAMSGFLKSDGKNYTTNIYVEDMDATVNGTPVAL